MPTHPVSRSLRLRPCRSFPRAFLGGIVGLLWATAAMADGAAVSLVLSDELGPIESLEIGRSLFLRATGLTGGAAVSFVLRDEAGRVVAEAAAIADGSGRTEEIEAWPHSGVVGCDCGSEVGTYDYARVEDAVYALAGRQLSIAVIDQAGSELVATPLALVEPVRPLAFSADGSGCPRFFRQSWEDLFLAVFGGSADSACEAQVFPGPTDSDATLLDPPIGDPVTWQGGGPSPEVLLLLQAGDSTPSELFIWFRCGSPPINSGLVIEDHSCPPPPPQPSVD